jgi:neutral amino acid transport system permease protein
MLPGTASHEKEQPLRQRLAAAVLGLLALLLLTPAATAASPSAVPAADSAAEAIQGTIRDPDGEPLEGISITVAGDGSDVGTATSDADGAWRVDLPGPGTYTVTLDTGTLPEGVQPRNVGGEVLADVLVRPQQERTVIFPLVSASTPQEEATSAPSASATASPGDESQPPVDSGPGSNRVLQLVVEGIKLGAIIAITAVGLSLVFGTTRLINFAHGELVTLGAMVAFWFSTSPFTLPLVFAALFAVAAGAATGGAMERVLWRPLRGRGAGLIQMFIISIGVSLLLRHVLLVLFGSRRRQYSQYAVQENIQLGPVSITPRDLIVVVLSGLVILGVAFMLQRTRIGKAMRAVSDNHDLAESSGIDVNRVVLVVWLVGGGLAALGGVFYGLTQAVYWDMGFNLLLLMFAGVILGGLGSAYGAVIGSLVVGLIAQLSTLWFPTELQYAWALIALILVLLVRPQGILGRVERAG